EMIRASLTRQTLSPDFKSSWRFYDFAPAQPAAKVPPATRHEEEVAGMETDSKAAAAAEGESKKPHNYRDKIEPHSFANDNKFWYRLDLAGQKRQFILVDATTGAQGPAFDHARAAESLSQATKKTVTADHLPIKNLTFMEDGASVLLAGEDATWK